MAGLRFEGHLVNHARWGCKMLSKAISLVLVAALLHGSVAAQDQQQSPSQPLTKMQEVLRRAQEKDKAVKVTLNKKIDNRRKFSGKVSDISDTGFVLTEQKTGTTKKFAYEDVQQVTSRGMSTGAQIAIGVGVVVGVFILVGLLVFKLRGH